LLLSIFFILGCISQESPAGGVEVSADGVRFVDFGADKGMMASGEVVGALVRVQNVGERKAEDVQICISRKGQFRVDEIALCAASDIPMRDLNAPDERVGLPGQSYEKYFTLTAPEAEFPVRQTLTAEARYGYSSEGTKEIPLLTRERMNELAESGAEIKAGSMVSSKSPLKIEIETRDPVQVGAGGEKDVSFDIVLTNIGKGAVRSREAELPERCGGQALNCVDTIQIYLVESAETPDEITCRGADGTGKERTIEGVAMWQGETARINCRLHVELGTDAERYPLIRAIARYSYYIQRNIEVEVLS